MFQSRQQGGRSFLSTTWPSLCVCVHVYFEGVSFYLLLVCVTLDVWNCERVCLWCLSLSVGLIVPVIFSYCNKTPEVRSSQQWKRFSSVWWGQTVVTWPRAPGLCSSLVGVAEEACPLGSGWEARKETKRLESEYPSDLTSFPGTSWGKTFNSRPLGILNI